MEKNPPVNQDERPEKNGFAAAQNIFRLKYDNAEIWKLGTGSHFASNCEPVPNFLPLANHVSPVTQSPRHKS
jgi:hypothetical protein